MKRYYLDNLNFFESVIKAILVNILITLFLFIVFLIARINFYQWYIYILGLMYICITIFHVIKGFEKRSFYVIDRTIFYCMKNSEEKINLNDIILIEEYFGLNYLFGKKTIIIHLKKNKYPFVLNKQKANYFKNILENAINNNEDFSKLNF